MVIVTGGAGFIGSCVVRALNDRGRDDIVIVDNIAATDKWLNIRNKKYIEYINKREFLGRLNGLGGGRCHYPHGSAVCHNRKRF